MYRDTSDCGARELALGAGARGVIPLWVSLDMLHFFDRWSLALCGEMGQHSPCGLMLFDPPAFGTVQEDGAGTGDASLGITRCAAHLRCTGL